MSARGRLVTIKLAHTLAWAFFAGCVLLIPVAALGHRFRIAAALIAIVFVEVLILALNGWRCPLTGVAARYTDERQDNFDIYLPLWLARHNKRIFGVLYAVGILATVWLWRSTRP